LRSWHLRHQFHYGRLLDLRSGRRVDAADATISYLLTERQADLLLGHDWSE
jgi:hypothetical protein